jgi:predicted O-linked N-acetylglucosamine transferase (SPINDLY family)
VPGTPEALLAEAASLLESDRAADAVKLLQAGRLRYPADAAVARRLADALQFGGRLAEAVRAYTIGLRLDENDADGWYGLGCAQLELKAYGAAALAFGRVAEVAPHFGPAQYNLAKSVFQLGRVETAIALFARAAELDPALRQQARASIACIIPGSPDADLAAVLRTRRRWAEAEARALPRTPPRTAPPPGGRLRLGYLSGFFGDRNWMKPVYALLNRHDRNRFELHLFSDGALPSAAAGYREHDDDIIHDLSGVPNAAAAGIIAERKIDVLIDLNGYSLQHRLPLLMHRPAPHIVGWFNSFAASGIAAVDILVGDAAVAPPAEAKYYGERIHRVPGTYLPFEILYPVPDPAPPPCLGTGTGTVTFGCLGSHYKFTDSVVAAWAEILRGAPTTRLFVKNGALDEASTRDDLLGRLAVLGIAPDRVTLEGRAEHFDFLDAYRHVDIALDTFSYNGGTTTTEALWQGVPVLAFDGDRWAARTSKSLLLAAGLGDWVMPDRAGYIRHAIALAADPETPARLAALRSEMRRQLGGSAACDVDGFRRNLEDLLQDLAAPRRRHGP